MGGVAVKDVYALISFLSDCLRICLNNNIGNLCAYCCPGQITSIKAIADNNNMIAEILCFLLFFNFYNWGQAPFQSVREWQTQNNFHQFRAGGNKKRGDGHGDDCDCKKKLIPLADQNITLQAEL